jgi:integrase
MTRDLDGFQEHLAKTLSASTAITYASALERALRDHAGDLLGILRRKRTGASTRQTYRAALRHWAEWTGDDALLARLASSELRREMKAATRARHLDAPRRYRVEPFSTDEEDAILRVLADWKERFEEDPDGAFAWRWPAVSMMFALGLRAGADLARLTRADVDAALRDGVELTIASKGDKDRSLPVVLVVDELRALQRLRKGRWKVLAEVISPGARSPVDAAYEQLRRTVKALATEAGLDPRRTHPHRFRHSAAHRLYEATGDLLKVQRFLGHESLTTTMRYLRAKRTAEIGDDLLRARRRDR